MCKSIVSIFFFLLCTFGSKADEVTVGSFARLSGGTACFSTEVDMLFKQHREIKKVADGTLLEFNEVKYSSPDGALLNTANLSAPVDLNATSRIHYGAQILRDCKAVGGQIETCSFKGKPLSCCHISYTSPQGEMILDT